MFSSVHACKKYSILFRSWGVWLVLRQFPLTVCPHSVSVVFILLIQTFPLCFRLPETETLFFCLIC